LLRFAIDAVFLDGTSNPGEIEIQIRWHTGTITVAQVNRPAPGEGSLKTPEEAVARIGELASTQSSVAIADQLNAAGCQTAFGRPFTRQHVGYLCRRHGWGRGKERSGPRTQESDPDTA